MQAFLWLMRHGHDDMAAADRPLTDQGKKAATAAGIALSRLKTPIQACLCSPLPRACDTAEEVCKHLDLEAQVEPKLDGAPVDIKALTRNLGNCLVVSHMPSLSMIVYRLTGAQMQFTKGGLAQIHEGELWTVLNPAETMAMAGMANYTDQVEVNSRSKDDWVKVQMPVSEKPVWRL